MRSNKLYNQLRPTDNQLKPADDNIELETVSMSGVVDTLMGADSIDDFIQSCQSSVSDTLTLHNFRVVKANVTNVVVCPSIDNPHRVLVTVTITPIGHIVD